MRAKDRELEVRQAKLDWAKQVESKNKLLENQVG
jgi:hypothetical protein